MEYLIPILYYYFAVLCISVYRQWQIGRLSLTNKILFCVPIFVFYLSDIVFNYTLFMVMGKPAGKTITERMAYYKAKDKGIREKIGRFLCNTLDEVDPSGVHCDTPP